ncbi:MAG: hypothetical protein EBR82_62185 [Caulobacteraceae bacterium]|nr:hypothetical protein [Caulobacteraceae bacterium]
MGLSSRGAVSPAPRGFWGARSDLADFAVPVKFRKFHLPPAGAGAGGRGAEGAGELVRHVDLAAANPIRYRVGMHRKPSGELRPRDSDACQDPDLRSGCCGRTRSP